MEVMHTNMALRPVDVKGAHKIAASKKGSHYCLVCCMCRYGVVKDRKGAAPGSPDVFVECRRNAPLLGQNGKVVWPEMAMEDWCGEFFGVMGDRT